MVTSFSEVVYIYTIVFYIYNTKLNKVLFHNGIITNMIQLPVQSPVWLILHLPESFLCIGTTVLIMVPDNIPSIVLNMVYMVTGSSFLQASRTRSGLMCHHVQVDCDLLVFSKLECVKMKPENL